jgi:hypothetical protein
MGLPVYKEIAMHTLNISEIEKIIQTNAERNSPIVVNLLPLNLLQNKALQMFETIITKNKFSFYFPYCFYFISNVENYRGSLSVFKSIYDLPSFFKGKDKMPNVKEAHLLNKIDLKVKKIKYIAETQIENSTNIDAGSLLQKDLFILSLEGNYLEQIKNHLDKQGKK